MTKKRFFLVVLYLISFYSLFSSTIKAELIIDLDHAVFLRESNTFLVEFYYSYHENAYSMQLQEPKGYYGNIDFKITVDTSNNLYREYVWKAPLQKEFEGENAQYIFGIRKIFLPSGKYDVTFEAQDEFNKKNIFKKKIKLNIDSPDPNKIFISSLQLANNIISGNTTGAIINNASNAPEDKSLEHPELFYKNQFYVYPNPSREIFGEYPTLYLYSEINNSKTCLPNGMRVRYVIYDATNRPVFDYEKEKSSVSDAAIVETISIPLDTYQSGVYYAEINISPKAQDITSDTVSQKTKFFLINRNVELESKTMYTDDELFERSEFATYTENRANSEFEKFNIVATSQERKSWDKLTDIKAKQRFLYKFWFVRNPDQNSEFNIELQKFRQRVEYANTYYSYGGKTNGWKTDRGKIHVRYGEPDQIEKNSSTPDKKAYEA